MSKGKNIGTDFAEFPGEEGLLEDAQAVAIKRVVAWQLDQLMKRQGMTKVELARRMNTSRAALDRLLDPENPSVTLHTLHSAAKAVGGRLNVSLEVPGGQDCLQRAAIGSGRRSKNSARNTLIDSANNHL